jgi:hypothetical protein
MIKTRVRLLIGGFASALLLAFGSVGIAAAGPSTGTCPPLSHPQGNKCKVTICHRTDSVTNPYVSPDVSVSAANGNTLGDHYSVHTGPVATSQQVAQSLKSSGQKWGDIIPPVEGVEPGQNWTPEGIAIYNNGCNYVTPGQGGGTPLPETPPPTTPTTPPTTFSSTTLASGGQGAGAPAPVVVPSTGSVNAGGGGGTQANAAAVVGFGASLLSVLAGAALIGRRILTRGV